MGVYIKGMEMPQEGCAVAVIFSDGETRVYTGEPVSVIECKAVPIPPHGDLIDRDALMKILSKVIDINASIEQRNEATDQERRCLWWFEQQIGIAPTIIPAEEGEA